MSASISQALLIAVKISQCLFLFIRLPKKYILGDILDIFTPDMLSGKLNEFGGHFQNLSGRLTFFEKTVPAPVVSL